MTIIKTFKTANRSYVACHTVDGYYYATKAITDPTSQRLTPSFPSQIEAYAYMIQKKDMYAPISEKEKP